MKVSGDLWEHLGTSVRAASAGGMGVVRMEDTMVRMGFNGKQGHKNNHRRRKKTRTFGFDLAPRLCPPIQLPYLH